MLFPLLFLLTTLPVTPFSLFLLGRLEELVFSFGRFEGVAFSFGKLLGVLTSFFSFWSILGSSSFTFGFFHHFHFVISLHNY
jgi:hypothetical protein